MTFTFMMALALMFDAVIGWPESLFRRIGHPVTWIGALIDRLEKRWNQSKFGHRRVWGAACTGLVVCAATLPALVAQVLLPDSVLGVVIGAVLAWPWLAARSLYDHVARVAQPLEAGDLPGARTSVAMIVGRDPATLDQAGVARSAIESLAESASDGVVAPLFWGVIAGLPGLVAYKAVNTLDSMIGHRNDRYEDFGKVAARLDDVLNYVPARLTALLFACGSGRARLVLGITLRDGRHHRSPNAGWPEAAMAGALNVRLSGPRTYGDRVAHEPWLNGMAPDPDRSAIRAALGLYVRALVLTAACLVGLALV